MNKPLILIVDDNTDNIEVIEEILERFDFDFYSINQSTQILDVLEYKLPDLILLDLYMPDQDGLTTLKMIKQIEQYKSIPVIMLTAETDKEVLSKCLKADAMDYLTKPVDVIELEARIFSALKISDLTNKLKQKNRELNKKNQELQRFTGMIVHDLKNPLTIITGCIDIIGNRLNQSKYNSLQEYADMIKKTAFSMRDSMNEILDVNRIQRGELKLKMVQKNPMPEIEKHINRMKTVAEKKTITITNNSVTLPEVKFDKNRLSEVMYNLMSNAIKYSSPNTTINLNYEISGDHLKILIKDEGLGMTEEDLRLVFKDFQKLSARPTAKESSTGLGLAIVKKVTEAMGGNVGVISEGKGKGSTFWFTLQR